MNGPFDDLKKSFDIGSLVPKKTNPCLLLHEHQLNKVWDSSQKKFGSEHPTLIPWPSYKYFPLFDSPQ